MKTIASWIGSLVLILSLAACGEHNQSAPNKGKNLDDTRIYGVIGGEPLQLQPKDAQPASDPETTEKIDKIREKFYPN
jgi:hypothetical protein